MEKQSICPFCGSALEYSQEHEDYAVGIGCPICGKYSYSKWDLTSNTGLSSFPKDMIAAYLYHNNKALESIRPESYTTFIGSLERFNGLHNQHPHYHYASFEEVKAFWQCRFSDRIDRILLVLSRRSKFFGEQMYLSFPEMQSLLFITRFNENNRPLESVDVEMQLSEMTDYLTTNEYAKISGDGDGFYVTLLAEGWKRVDELQQQGTDSKEVFVSMSFAPSAALTREAIRNGIIKADFSPEFIDEIIHNRQIVPEMFRLIRECRFLILDISEPNYGAYYEAGYALGLGKEVIITCSAEVFSHKYESEEEKKYERYLKPHFDIAQKQILVWNDYDDLTRKLCEWIKALIR